VTRYSFTGKWFKDWSSCVFPDDMAQSPFPASGCSEDELNCHTAKSGESMWRIVYKACQRYGAIQENPANLRVNGHPAGISRKFEIDQIIRAGCGEDLDGNASWS
jgi:hypothetical protein